MLSSCIYMMALPKRAGQVVSLKPESLVTISSNSSQPLSFATTIISLPAAVDMEYRSSGCKFGRQILPETPSRHVFTKNRHERRIFLLFTTLRQLLQLIVNLQLDQLVNVRMQAACLCPVEDQVRS